MGIECSKMQLYNWLNQIKAKEPISMIPDEKDLIDSIRTSQDPAAALKIATEIILLYLSQPESFVERALDALREQT